MIREAVPVATRPPNLDAVIAHLLERDERLLAELAALRAEVTRIEGRLWLVAIGGLGAGSLGGAGAAVVQALAGGI